jgi:hypothetical protein
MPAISICTIQQDLPGEKRFAPERDQPGRIQIPGMNRPEPHRTSTLSCPPGSAPEMSLLPDPICLGDPGYECLVDVLGTRDPKVMNMIAPGDCVHTKESRVPVNRGKNKVTAQPAPLDRDGHERHAHLEGDSRFFREDLDRTAGLHGRPDTPEQSLDQTRLAREVLAERSR